MIQKVLVVGAGSAGLMAALALKVKMPQLAVTVLHDPATPVIGVGESTTPNMPEFLFGYLKLGQRHFYETTKATWKIGIHFLWGPRPHFEYPFERQLDSQWMDLPKPNGFYCQDEFSMCQLVGGLMAHKKAFLPSPKGGGPFIEHSYAFHLYNPSFVTYLEEVSKEQGISIIHGKLDGIVKGAQRVSEVVLSDGSRLGADLFVDASGFQSLLLGRAMEEPFVSYGSSLYCDRAIVGSWQRSHEPILPYTTVETMDAGWCWQIEHEQQINRGYVFSSSALTDDQAQAEFMRKNPRATTWDHAVKFKSGRYRRVWVENVVAIGNASGFVEPLEATALMQVAVMSQNLAEHLLQCDLEPDEKIRKLYNDSSCHSWDDIRNFLSMHYRFNTRLETPFWRRCLHEVDVEAIKPVLEFYADHGPTGLCRHLIGNIGLSAGLHSAFGVDGYLTMLVGNKVPYKQRYKPTAQEWARWERHRQEISTVAASGLTCEQALWYIRSPGWRWVGEPPAQGPMKTAENPPSPGLNVTAGWKAR